MTGNNIWSCPGNKKKLFLKLAVPKTHAKPLKNLRNFAFIAFAGCSAEISLKNKSSTSISQGFRKTCLSAPCMWNNKKPNNQCINGSLDMFNIIYMLLVSLYVFKF